LQVVAVESLQTGIINFDYSFSFLLLPGYGPGAAAIGSAGDIWNSVEASYPLSGLQKTDGTVTGVGWSITQGGGGAEVLGGPYGRLCDVYTYFNAASITGLVPDQSYDLYLFASILTNGVDVNGVTFSTPALPHNTDVNSLNEGVQYAAHTVVANASGQLVFAPLGGSSRNPFVASWQLVAVPEPGVTSFTILALAAITATRRVSQRKS
jgi:hypothetical protein